MGMIRIPVPSRAMLSFIMKVQEEHNLLWRHDTELRKVLEEKYGIVIIRNAQGNWKEYVFTNEVSLSFIILQYNTDILEDLRRWGDDLSEVYKLKHGKDNAG